MADPIHVLLVDDEPLALDRLALLCARDPDLTVVGTACDGADALAQVAALAPDLVLLDIAMPGLDGMQVARTLAGMATRPAIIFCTAHERFAVAAFDVAAVDYLLKPVAPDRLARAVARVRDQRAMLPAIPVADAGWTEEFWIPNRSEMIRISATDIERIEAERDYMRLHVGPRSYLLHETITALEKRLDPARFVRLHRSTIVRRDRIAKLRHDGLGGWHADLVDGSSLRIGRTYLPAARAIAGR